MSKVGRRAWLVAAILEVVLAGGCGDDRTNRYAVSGVVTLRQKPLDQGTIEFVPIGAPSQGVPFTQSGAVIQNGQYAISKSQGLAAGKYKVLISSGDGQTPAAAGEAPGPSGNFTSKDRIPREYNVASKLEVEVKMDGPNRFDFPIP
jgi:hypothetical protein